ncbi:MAG: hypothetical protein ABJY83_04665 [Roseibium sp.]
MSYLKGMRRPCLPRKLRPRGSTKVSSTTINSPPRRWNRFRGQISSEAIPAKLPKQGKAVPGYIRLDGSITNW